MKAFDLLITEFKKRSNLRISFLILAVLFIGLMAAFGLIAHEVFIEQEEEFDKEAFEFFDHISNDRLVWSMRKITFFGSRDFFLAAYLSLFALLLFLKRKTDAFYILATGLVASLLVWALKLVFARERPDMPLFDPLTNYGFPSGHAVSSFIFVSNLAYLSWRSKWPLFLKWVITIFLFTFSLLIGISRIVLRYHYASDVLAGFCLGVALLIFSLWILDKINERKRTRLK
jgi:membrane-associated phospholipid phosphatase